MSESKCGKPINDPAYDPAYDQVNDVLEKTIGAEVERRLRKHLDVISGLGTAAFITTLFEDKSKLEWERKELRARVEELKKGIEELTERRASYPDDERKID